MKIQCILLRAGGTVVELGDKKYHFKPESDKEGAPHVAEVKDEKHAKRLLSITEAYRGVGAEAAAVQKEIDDAAKKVAAGNGLEGQIDPNAEVVSEETIVEILEALDELIDAEFEAAKKKKKSLVRAEFTVQELTNKAVSDFFEEQTGKNPKNKTEIRDYAAACEIELRTDNQQPAALIRDLFAKLSAKFPPEPEGGEGGGDSDAGDTEE